MAIAQFIPARSSIGMGGVYGRSIPFHCDRGNYFDDRMPG